ncbi:hypothetical protein QFC21_007275 [Naganishia friedmannii]|uniref:Uncharacterized protein n=1 Tax=Naganishia friedmannii TaxID=89922 RepID=A0ACC2UXS6_9TREE|nr:hypothetical protein QFC21_007275 [Naganishia friedmannii]
MATDNKLDGAEEETYALVPLSPPRTSPLDALLAFVHDVTGSGTVRDGLKLIVVGGILEASRRGLAALCRQVYYCESLRVPSSTLSCRSSKPSTTPDATIEAIFSEDDPAYRWIIAWLSVPERQQDARNFEVISTKYQDDLPEQLAGVEDAEKGGRALSRGLALIPAFDHPRYIRFEGRMYRFERYTENKLFGDPVAMLKVSTSIKQSASRLVTYTPAKGNTYWHETSSRPARSLQSVVLPEGVKERVVRDLSEFLAGSSWYAERGYLCYGVPGSGKSSLISCMAGHFSLPVYIVNLAQSGLDDSALSELIGLCPPKSILLMEDIRVASDASDGDAADERTGRNVNSMLVPSKASTVTLSGLQYGRLDCVTYVGRMDVLIEFKYATSQQIHDLFTNFYPPTSTKDLKPNDLADRFAEQVPGNAFSVAAIQGFLMQYRSEPEQAVQNVQGWVSRGGKSG